VRRRVGPDTGEREQPLLDLVVGELRVVQGLEVEPAVGAPRRELEEVTAAIPGADDVAVERLAGDRHRRGGGEGAAAAGRLVSEVRDEGADHALGRGPRAVRRADRLHDVLEDGGAADDPSGAPGRPGESRVGCGDRVETGEVFVEAEQVRRRAREVAREPGPGARTHRT
jgi:hypothetical protein